MLDSNQTVIKIDKISHVGFVVYDLDKYMKSLWNNFCIGPWDIGIRDYNSSSPEEAITDMTYYGRPGQFSYRLAVSRNRFGGIRIELIQPISGDSIYRDFLRDHGDGIHHFGGYAGDSLEDFNDTIKTLEKKGFPCIMSGRSYIANFAYIDTTKVLNTILEVVWLNPTRSRL